MLADDEGFAGEEMGEADGDDLPTTLDVFGSVGFKRSRMLEPRDGARS